MTGGRGGEGPRARKVPTAERKTAPRLGAKLTVKRGMDVVLAAVALTLTLPLSLGLATAILLTQGRPVLFRHERPGLGGKPFTMMKFRTMRPVRGDEVWYQTDDQRVTRLGRFLRVTSLDELPELINVLKGEMSVVGPRPLLTEYLDYYSGDQRRRHDMKPGLTGWAAVHGRHALKFDDRIDLDVWYVDNWSLRLDLVIIAKTVLQLARRDGVAVTQDLGEVGFPLPGVVRAESAAAGHGQGVPSADPAGPGDVSEGGDHDEGTDVTRRPRGRAS